MAPEHPLWRRGAALLVLALGLAGPASAGDPSLRERVLEQLSAYDTPPTAATLQALGAGVEEELLGIAGDPSSSRHRRAAATHALGWFPSERSRAFAEARLADAAEDSHVRRAGAWALANGWGDAALPALERASADADVQLRIQVARALGTLRTPAARAVLDRWALRERDPAVTTALQKARGEE